MMTKVFRMCIIILTIVLVAGIGCGIYVWYTLQKIESMQAIDVGESSSTTVQDVAEKAQPTLPPANVQEPVVIDVNSLTPAQQKIFESFGYKEGTVTISPATIQCAESALGKTRLAEIINGSAPSPIEAIKLASCMGKTAP